MDVDLCCSYRLEWSHVPFDSLDLRSLMTRKDVLHFFLLTVIVAIGLAGSYNILYKIAKRQWLINDSILHLGSIMNREHSN